MSQSDDDLNDRKLLLSSEKSGEQLNLSKSNSQKSLDVNKLTIADIDRNMQKSNSDLEINRSIHSDNSDSKSTEDQIEHELSNRPVQAYERNHMIENSSISNREDTKFDNVCNQQDDQQSSDDNRSTISDHQYLKQKIQSANGSNNAIYDNVSNQFEDRFSDQCSDSSSIQQSNDTANQLDKLSDEASKELSVSHLDSKTNNNAQDNEQVDKLKTELNRLKKHLIQIEEDYTNELVEVQQREQTLEQQLIEARSEIEQLNSRLNNTGPLVALRQQAEQALDERDQAFQRCNKLEDEVQRGQASLANLQLVIERMQKDHDQRLQTANKLYEQNLREERCRYAQLENEINKYQLKLKESNNALQAAARLSAQLHSKQDTIDQLKNHLQTKEELVQRLHDEINNLNASCTGKVDKQFIKNLVVGYFNAATDKKQDVSRLLARILDFNEQEM